MNKQRIETALRRLTDMQDQYDEYYGSAPEWIPTARTALRAQLEGSTDE